MSNTNESFYVEITDTFGGEANYSWVKRFIVKARTFRGAISKVSKETGYNFKCVMNSGDMKRYDAKGNCVCAFAEYADEFNTDQSRIVCI